jgi:hypothetical protein
MFAQALQEVSKYTMPVIISKRLANGNVECGCATFMLLNSDGWILTAAHVLQDLVTAQQHAAARAEVEKRIAEIQGNPNLSPGQRRKQIQRLPKNSDWILNQSHWWGYDGWRIQSFEVDHQADMAVEKIDSFDPALVTGYPVLRNPARELLAGTSLCRLGFPFHRITATFEEGANRFKIADGVLPMPRFPNEGIHTRVMIDVDQASGREVKFIETSHPGLRGQSGGPVFDVNGYVWGIQSHTMHLPLGFAPKAREGNREWVEHQFMHVGMATHVEEIVRFLSSHGIRHTLSP